MERLLVTPGAGQNERIRIRRRLTVDRAKLSYLEARGWTRHGNRHRGRFKTKYGEWWGEAELVAGELNLFIYSPPRQVRNGPHGACFETHVGDNWWWVHFWKESANPADEVMAIERALEESFES